MPETTAVSTFDWLAAAKAVVILLAGWMVARLAARAFRHTVAHRFSAHQQAIFGRLIFYVLLALFAATAMHQLGFQLSVLLGAAGILTVALGFASQTSASNLISGLFLLGEKPFEVGDVIRVDTDTGEVIAIDLLSVKLRTFDNLLVRIPNEVLIKSKFVNMTRFPIRRIDLTIGVAYRENLDHVIGVLLEIVRDEPRCFEEPAPFCIVSNFAASSVDLQVSFWARREVYRDLRSDIMKRIKSRFDADGIEIPFPHVSVYAGSRTEPLPVRISDDSRSGQMQT